MTEKEEIEFDILKLAISNVFLLLQHEGQIYLDFCPL